MEAKFWGEIGQFALSIFESIFANRIKQYIQNKEVEKNFNKIDNSIIDEISDKVSDEYYREKLSDQITRNRSFLLTKIDFITQEERKEFIDDFYKKNSDLKYVGSNRINDCLNSYIDMINEELNKRISQEGKVIIERIEKSEENIISNQDSNTNKIIKEINELKKNKEQVIYKNYNIPVESKLFYGRIIEMDTLLKFLKSPNLVFINGMGGIGKSQIVKKYINEHKNEYCIIVWISAENIENLNSSYRQVALFYNLIENNKNYDQGYINDLVKNYFNGIEKSMLIIDGIDDVEFNDLFNYIPSNTSVIITTQNSNIDPNEFNIVPVGNFQDGEAKNFIIENTSSRVCTENDPVEAEELTLLMEYYPLALEYARAYINKHRVSIKEYKELYREHSVSLLTSKLPSYKKTTYTAWKISFDKAVERNSNTYKIMAMCSFFASVRIPFREIFSKSEYKIAELIEIEENLLNYSLITIDGGYIGVHGIIQELNRKMLDEKGENIKYLEQDIALLISNFPLRINDNETNRKVAELLPHARKVFDFCIDKKIKKIDEFCGVIGNKLYVIGMYIEAIEYFKTALVLNLEDREYFRYVENTTFLIQAYHYTGNSEVALEVSDEIVKFIEKEKSFNEGQKDFLNGNILGATGIVEKDMGEIEKALGFYNASLVCYERINHVEGKINQLINIGITYKYQENYILAMKTYNKALMLCKEDSRNRGKILGNIGHIYKIQGDIPRAYKIFNEALDIYKEIGDLRSECIDYHHIAECELCMGNIIFAEENLEKSLKIAQKINYVIGIINVYLTYALIYKEEKNDLVKAKEYFELAYKLSDQVSYAQGKDYSIYYLRMLR